MSMVTETRDTDKIMMIFDVMDIAGRLNFPETPVTTTTIAGPGIDRWQSFVDEATYTQLIDAFIILDAIEMQSLS